MHKAESPQSNILRDKNLPEIFDSSRNTYSMSLETLEYLLLKTAQQDLRVFTFIYNKITNPWNVSDVLRVP